MLNTGRRIILLCLCLAFSPIAHATLSEVDRNRLADEVDSAKQNLDPSRLPSLDQSQAEVVERIETVKSFFQRKTSEENYQAWMDYLNLDPLLESIESKGSPGQIGREAIDLGYRLVGTAPGLELTVLQNLRDSVNRLVASIRFRDPDKTINTLANQLDSLSQRIRQLDKRPSADDAAAISAMITILTDSGQTPELVTSIRNTFHHANAAVLVGDSLVQSVVGQNVNQASPVNDCILGTRIIGTATLNGQVSTTLLPAMGSARINIALSGTVYSNNIGYNGPVRLRTSGTGQVFASRALTINESGILLDRVHVEGTMQTQINSIEPKMRLGSRLVKKIARKKAAEQKPQTDRIANHKLRTRVGEQFSTRTDEQAAVEIPDFMREVRPVLTRLSLIEPDRLWQSDSNAIYIDVSMARPDQMTTVVARPTISGVFSAAVQLHESAINNAATPILAGRTMGENQLADLMESVGREMPNVDESSADEDQAPFEITFSRLRPVIFEARDQVIRVGLRGTRFAQGSREIKRAMEITATYQSQAQDDGTVILTRIGEVAVDFPGDHRLSASQVGLRSTIQTKFSKVFPEALLDQPLKVPDTVQLEAIRGRVFKPRVVDAMHGWLTIAVQ